MKNPISFHSAAVVGLQKCFKIWLFSGIVATGFFITLFSVGSGGNPHLDNNLQNVMFNILFMLILTIVVFIFVTAPLTAIPAALGAVILSIMLHKDRIKDKLSIFKSEVKGAVTGFILGILLLTPGMVMTGSSVDFSDKPFVSGYFFYTNFLRLLIVAFPITGAIMGYRLGGSLAIELMERFEDMVTGENK